MKSGYTDVTIIMDTSGSMRSCQSDMEGGVNAFIEQQSAQPGECLLTLVEFNTTTEVVHKAVPVSSVPKYSMDPSGFTALLDAVGDSVTAAGERFSAMPESDRPSLVVFVIVTDGEENSSKRFSREQVKKIVEHQQAVYGWQFVFLGANQDAFDEAGKIGVANASGYSPTRSGCAMAAASNSVSRMRGQSFSGQAIDASFTSDELQSMT